MAETLLGLWVLGVGGYLLGLAVHLSQAVRYRRYRPRARYRWVVAGWIFDETNRAVVKAILATWGLARLALIAQRDAAEAASPTVLHLDLLTLALYWGLLLLFTNWTWRVRCWRRRRYPELRGHGGEHGH